MLSQDPSYSRLPDELHALGRYGQKSGRGMYRYEVIAAMSGSVLVAPLALEGDTSARRALLTTAVIMLLLKKPLPARAAASWSPPSPGNSDGPERLAAQRI